MKRIKNLSTKEKGLVMMALQMFSTSLVAVRESVGMENMFKVINDLDKPCNLSPTEGKTGAVLATVLDCLDEEVTRESFKKRVKIMEMVEPMLDKIQEELQKDEKKD